MTPIELIIQLVERTAAADPRNEPHREALVRLLAAARTEFNTMTSIIEVASRNAAILPCPAMVQ